MMNSFIAEISDKKRTNFNFCYRIFIYYILLATQYLQNIRKVEKKKMWPGDLTETIGAYEMLGLLEVRARAV